mgnify:CR=1 FL=1
MDEELKKKSPCSRLLCGGPGGGARAVAVVVVVAVAPGAVADVVAAAAAGLGLGDQLVIGGEDVVDLGELFW